MRFSRSSVSRSGRAGPASGGAPPGCQSYTISPNAHMQRITRRLFYSWYLPSCSRSCRRYRYLLRVNIYKSMVSGRFSPTHVPRIDTINIVPNKMHMSSFMTGTFSTYSKTCCRSLWSWRKTGHREDVIHGDLEAINQHEYVNEVRGEDEPEEPDIEYYA